MHPGSAYREGVIALRLHHKHERWGAAFAEVEGAEVVRDYGDVRGELRALRECAAVLDLSCRSRLAVTGRDRDRFLNGQVTNDLNRLAVWQGCYAAMVNARGRMDGDANIYRLPEEWLLDSEPGLTEKLSQRLLRYVVADDVCVADVAPHYGLLSLQGPLASALLQGFNLAAPTPTAPGDSVRLEHAAWGELYVMNQPRVGQSGYDLYVPSATLESVAEALHTAATALGGRWIGWDALEIARVEGGIPRYGADMDDATLPPEAQLEARAISYNKGCYIGQEVIARLRTYGQVARLLRGLKLPRDLAELPPRDTPLLWQDKEVGHVTSSVLSPLLDTPIGLGYVRRECNQIGTRLELQGADGVLPVEVVGLPFAKP